MEVRSAKTQFLEYLEIEKGLNSGMNNKSHEDIIKDIKQKYA